MIAVPSFLLGNERKHEITFPDLLEKKRTPILPILNKGQLRYSIPERLDLAAGIKDIEMPGLRQDLRILTGKDRGLLRALFLRQLTFLILGGSHRKRPPQFSDLLAADLLFTHGIFLQVILKNTRQ